jgi:hypothetical protein
MPRQPGLPVRDHCDADADDRVAPRCPVRNRGLHGHLRQLPAWNSRRLASITDAIGAIIAFIVAIIWAIIYFVVGIMSVIKNLKLKQAAGVIPQ